MRAKPLLLKILFISLILNSKFSFASISSINGLDLRSGQITSISLSEPSKANVIIFVSARCPCSASHEKSMTELYKKYSPLGFQFIGIHSNSDEPIHETEQHFKKSNLPFPIIQDDGAKIANELKALKTPHVFILSPKSEVLFQGGIDDSHLAENAKQFYLIEALEALTTGKPLLKKEVRTLGCVIKRP